MRYRTKVVIALLLLTMLTSGLLLWLSYRGASALLFAQIQSKVLSVATTAALQVDGEAHERLRTRADEAGEIYAQLAAKLRAVRDANRRDDIFTKFIYTMRPDPADPTKWQYVVDAEEAADEKSHLGDVVEYKSEDQMGFSLVAPRAEAAFSVDKFGTWLSANAPIYNAAGKPVALIGVDIDAAGVLAEQRRLLVSGALASGIAIIVALLCSLALSRWVSAPLSRLQTAVEAIAEGKLETRVDVQRRDEFGEVGVAINAMAVALRERETLKGALARYVSQHVAENIIADNKLPDLKGNRRCITVLFCDIRNFTRFANGLPPEEVVAFLNEYFTEMIDVIFTNHGTLDKFLGDGLMAVFGAPLDDPEHERHAVSAALEMQRRLAKLRERWHGEKAEIASGIGIHTGDAIVGNIGSELRMEYTAIGDTVNIASRLEAATKEYGCEILLSESTAAKLDSAFALRRIGDIQCRGVAQSLTIYAVEGRPAPGAN
jgi:adenylate cyclase